MKPLGFILTTTMISYVMMIPIIFFFVFLDIGEEQIGGFNTENIGFLAFFILIVIIAPPFETLTSQIIPIKVVQRLFNDKTEIVAILISSSIFAYLHSGYSIWYSLLIFPLGVILAKTYIIFQKRKESSFWVTTSVHSLRNLIATIAIYA